MEGDAQRPGGAEGAGQGQFALGKLSRPVGVGQEEAGPGRGGSPWNPAWRIHTNVLRHDSGIKSGQVDPAVIFTITGRPAELSLEEFIEHLRLYPGRTSVISDPHGVRVGDVCRVTDLCQVDMLDEGVLPGRHTLITIRSDNGRWKVAHSHRSEPVTHNFGK